MKILTLNTHSHNEDEKCLDLFAKGILKKNPDIIVLQEVNQTIFSPVVHGNIKEDNYAYQVAERLNKKGLKYHFTWLYIKKAYGLLEEGLAILSKTPFEKEEHILLSHTDSEHNWKKRMALGVKTNNIWIYNVHLGFFGDEEEPFEHQWDMLLSAVKDKENLFIAGDFNVPAHIKDGGYDMVRSSGFFDCWDSKTGGYTVVKEIDGWRNNKEKKRIDYIWSNEKIPIKSAEVVFDGKNEAVVSDHFGVLVEF